MSDLPDPHLDAPEQTGAPYVLHRPRRGVNWLIRDPEFPLHALVGVHRDLTGHRSTPVPVKIFLDLVPGTRFGGYNPLLPILSGILYPDNQFAKGSHP